MYTKICRNVEYILYTNILYTFWIQKFVEMWDIFCIQTLCIHSVYKSLLKCEIHFVYKHYVYILYTKCIQKFVEIWNRFCIQTFCIHFVYISSDLQKAYIINIMYTIRIQN